MDTSKFANRRIVVGVDAACPVVVVRASQVSRIRRGRI